MRHRPSRQACLLLRFCLRALRRSNGFLGRRSVSLLLWYGFFIIVLAVGTVVVTQHDEVFFNFLGGSLLVANVDDVRGFAFEVEGPLAEGFGRACGLE